jgi:hypothetical protein
LKQDSSIMNQCTALASEFEKHHHPLVQLEAISFEHSLIMFALQTVNMTNLLPFLKKQFVSPYLILRKASVMCLKQLKVGFLLNNEDLLEKLFVMLDNEKNAALRKEIQTVIRSLLEELAPNKPSQLVNLCKKMVLSNERGGSIEEAPNKHFKEKRRR